jgi:D-xylose transport system substrate-binding protein
MAGCGGGGGASGKIALLLPDEKAPRYRTHDRPEFERKASALCGGCKVLYSNAGGDPARQQKQADEAIAKGAEVLVVDPVGEEATGIVEKAKKKGVPVISYDRLIINSEIDYYVDVRDQALGAVMAEALSERLTELGKSEGPLALITTNTSGSVNLGASHVFDTSGLKVAAASYMPAAPEASAALSRRAMRRAIATLGPNGFHGVFAIDDKAANGAIEAMTSAGIDPASKVTTGSGATIPGLRRLLAKEQYMTVYLANEEEAATAAEMAVEILSEGRVAPSRINAEPSNGFGSVPAILLRPVPVTRDTIKSTVIDNGFVDPAQLCAGGYAKYCRELGIE